MFSDHCLFTYEQKILTPYQFNITSFTIIHKYSINPQKSWYANKTKKSSNKIVILLDDDFLFVLHWLQLDYFPSELWSRKVLQVASTSKWSFEWIASVFLIPTKKDFQKKKVLRILPIYRFLSIALIFLWLNAGYQGIHKKQLLA